MARAMIVVWMRAQGHGTGETKLFTTHVGYYAGPQILSFNYWYENQILSVFYVIVLIKLILYS